MSNARNLANLLGTSTSIPTDKLPTIPADKLPTGGSAQVKHAQSTDISSHTGGLGTFTDSNLTINFTPNSTSNKLLINVSFIYGATASAGNQVRLKRVIGATTSYIYFDDPVVGNTRNTLGNIRSAINNNQGFGVFSTVIEDSPATTSQITYTLQGEHQGGGTLYINGRNDGLNDCDRLGHITITELAS
jgi:hypothetical protein